MIVLKILAGIAIVAVLLIVWACLRGASLADRDLERIHREEFLARLRKEFPDIDVVDRDRDRK